MKRMNTAATRPCHRHDRADLRDGGRMTIERIVARIRWLDEMLKALQRKSPEKGVTHWPRHKPRPRKKLG